MQSRTSESREILIFADPRDYNASAVQWMLSQNGMKAICSQSISTLDPHGVSILFDDKHNFRAYWKSRKEIGAVWYRRAQDSAPQLPCDPRDEKFVAGEWKDVQRGLFFAASDFVQSFWVNDPLAAINAENKLLQLKLAKEIGLNVPGTLVSNDAAEIKKFISEKGPVVAKTFGPHMWSAGEDRSAFGTSVSILTDASELDDRSLMVCPTIYQRLVAKVCDIRVTIIGNRLFSARLGSSAGGALLDWRPSTFTSDLTFEAVELPRAIEQKLLLLQRKLGLVFGCVDLAVDVEGNYFFFEVNQGGQFLFVEELLPSLPLLRAFSAMLAQGRQDYAMDSMADMGYADYKASAEYLELAAHNRAEAQAFVSTIELRGHSEPSESLAG